ncbi:hypothetical protein OG473_01260 [Streptomyces anulatus]|uniref:hypothetical protein n=1 Tax=Streptomyces anulatus TaxID=1892 RepID=UPI003256572D
MPDVWENTRSRWESVRHAVDGGGPGAGAAATALHGRLGLSVNPIAVTGEAGAGKTVLYDALTQAIRTGDSDSSRSPDIEKHATVLRSGNRRTRAAVTVIPGQLSTQRERALQDTMRGDASPHGIVHVVCWGHNRIWQRGSQRDVQEALAADGAVDQEAVRNWHLRKETADFRLLVDAIIDGQLAKRLRWLIVAVSKCDLYWDRLDEARGHFLPMASRLIRHQYLPGLPVGTSQLDDAQIGALRTHFGQELQTFITQRNGG